MKILDIRTNARQKEMRSGTHVNHGYSNEFLDSDRTANVYFTSDVDAKNRIRSLNEFSKINLNEIMFYERYVYHIIEYM